MWIAVFVWNIAFCGTDGVSCASVCVCVCTLRLSQKPTPEFVLLVAVTWILSNFPQNTFVSSLLPVN